jgi:hypothetical protein
VFAERSTTKTQNPQLGDSPVMFRRCPPQAAVVVLRVPIRHESHTVFWLRIEGELVTAGVVLYLRSVSR